MQAEGSITAFNIFMIQFLPCQQWGLRSTKGGQSIRPYVQSETAAARLPFKLARIITLLR